MEFNFAIEFTFKYENYLLNMEFNFQYGIYLYFKYQITL